MNKISTVSASDAESTVAQLRLLVDGVEVTTQNGSSLTYTFDSQQEHTGIAELLRSLAEEGLEVKDLHSSESSLEEIFVNLVREQG